MKKINRHKTEDFGTNVMKCFRGFEQRLLNQKDYLDSLKMIHCWTRFDKSEIVLKTKNKL